MWADRGRARRARDPWRTHHVVRHLAAALRVEAAKEHEAMRKSVKCRPWQSTLDRSMSNRKRDRKPQRANLSDPVHQPVGHAQRSSTHTTHAPNLKLLNDRRGAHVLLAFECERRLLVLTHAVAEERSVSRSQSRQCRAWTKSFFFRPRCTHVKPREAVDIGIERLVEMSHKRGSNLLGRHGARMRVSTGCAQRVHETERGFEEQNERCTCHDGVFGNRDTAIMQQLPHTRREAHGASLTCERTSGTSTPTGGWMRARSFRVF